MKVTVSSTGDTLDAPMDPRFGRCRTFLLVDTEKNGARPVPNDAMMEPGGAGIQAAKTVVDLGAEAVITGQLGPKASQALSAAGIPVYVNASGTGRQALEAFKQGRLKLFQETAPGTGTGPGMGRGRGMGGGRGMGRGRGGRGRGA